MKPRERPGDANASTAAHFQAPKTDDHEALEVICKGTFRERWTDGDAHVIQVRQP